MTLKSFFRKKRNILTVAVMAGIILLASVRSKGFLMVGLFVLFAALCAVISYYQANLRSPVDLSPTFFFVIILATKYGVFYPLFFIPVATLIPALLAGGEVGIGSLLFMCSFVIIGFLSNIFIGYGIVAVGIGAVIANLVASWFINRIMGWSFGFIFSIFNAAITLFYFVSFGPFLFRILS
jgi:hypothetical protein